MTALQNENGPAATAIAPDLGSTNPTKDKEMNSNQDSTGTAPLPAPRPVKLKLLDIYDLVCDTSSLIDAVDMAAIAILDKRQREAMTASFDVIMGRMDDIKGQIEAVREEVQ